MPFHSLWPRLHFSVFRGNPEATRRGARGKAAAAAVLCGLCQAGWAQSPLPGSGATQDRTPLLPPAPAAPSGVELAPPSGTEAGAQDARRVDVKSFVLEGNSAFDSATLLAAAAAKPGPMTLTQLRMVAQAITAFYRARAYAVAQARLPAQDVSDGVVRIVVLEGLLEDVTVRSEDAAVQQRASEVLDARLAGAVGSPLKQDELEHAVILGGEAAAASMHAVLAPGQRLAGTHVGVQADPVRRFDGGIILNNDGLPSTGRLQMVVGGTLRSLLTQGDTLSGTVMASERGADLYGYNLQYDRFLGSRGWYGGLRAWQTSYSLAGGFSTLEASGRARATGLHFGYALERANTGRTRTDVRTGFNHVDLRDEIARVSVSSQRHVDLVWADIGGDILDQALQRPALTRWRLGLSKGRLGYGNASEAAADAAGLQRAGTYSLFSAMLRREQALGHGFDLVGHLRGQAADKNLDSYHKMGLGGSGAVRAFGTDAPAGDDAYIATLEAGHSTASNFWDAAAQWRLAAFYDYGRIRYNHIPLAGTASNSVVRAGYGLQLSLARRIANGRDFSARLYLAHPDRQASDSQSTGTTLTRFELQYPF